jgi:tetratricopeptide (TPR) repeat protein
MNERDIEKIKKMTKEIMESDDDERRAYLADNILDIDPGNAVAKYIKWQSSVDDESIHDTRPLEEAIASLRPVIEAMGESESEESDIYPVYVAMLADLASFLYVSGQRDRAFDAASEFMKLDNDCVITGRMVYYAVLIERGEFDAAIQAAENDIYETPPGEYCSAIAAFETDDNPKEAAERLISAISMDPDLPYYILGLWTIDENELDGEEDYDGYVEDTMMTVAVLSELWSANEERLAFISAIAFAFGYITGRVGGADDMELIEGSYRELGCLEAVQESRDILHAMLASGRDQEEVDEQAISMFREADYFGILG